VRTLPAERTQLTRLVVVPPTTGEVQALYDAAPDWFRVAIVFGAGLGLRQAEASGLTVDRIDWLRDRSVRIDRQWRTKTKPFTARSAEVRGEHPHHPRGHDGAHATRWTRRSATRWPPSCPAE